MAKNTVPADIAKMSFETALDELETIVRKLEEGETKLEDAIKSYERGAHLKRHCEAKLQEAKTRVDKVVLNADGAVGVESANQD
ncbi:MAG: exodeoxyribonuclease VII small subunit [Rhodospirillales bacterium]|jgi:exodeoxyribonuclease VII small subunit